MTESNDLRNPDGDEEDHDLLTFHESRARLSEELTAVQAALAASEGAERELLQARVDALADAVNRNTRIAEDQPGEQGFLEYTPPTSESAP